MDAVKRNSVVLVKEKRTSQGRSRGLFAFMLWGIPSAYTSQLGGNREEQGGALNSKIAVIAMLQFEALEDGESRVKSNNTGSFLGNAGIT